ncbi:TadE family protein [Rothia sp. ZJ1223]|uniref:TadE family protein n=1 Tax=Rothia sp. ZJ1223 TaxID=2811098 RepID=UPI0019578940|nr:TadE/TadG family type IV pilus assembly protein [Rothia sp. ZJ1223]MBM7051036.1 pilus assembly protein [Rothia sp. ZJ1223]
MRQNIRESYERGNATAEFVMVVSLVILLFAGVLQLAFILHTRNMLQDAVSSGARYGTLLDRSHGEGAVRAQELIQQTLPDNYASDVSFEETTVDGVRMLKVTARTPLPIIGSFGISDVITVSGHAIIQSQ